MKAIRFHQFGDAENLREDEIDIPVPQFGQVLLRLAGTSINPVDFKVREGAVPFVNEAMLPYTGGRDIAGWVEALGEGVSSATIGDAVIGLPVSTKARSPNIVLSGRMLSPPRRKPFRCRRPAPFLWPLSRPGRA